MFGESFKFFDLPTTKWQSFKFFAKLNENHILMTNFPNFASIRHLVIGLHNLSKGQLSDMKSYEKPLFTITGPSKIQLLKFWRFNFSNFQTTFVKNFMKNFQVSKYILKVLIKSYRFTNICDLKILYNQAAALWIFL